MNLDDDDSDDSPLFLPNPIEPSQAVLCDNENDTTEDTDSSSTSDTSASAESEKSHDDDEVEDDDQVDRAAPPVPPARPRPVVVDFAEWSWCCPLV